MGYGFSDVGQGVESTRPPCGDICHIFRQVLNGFCGIAIGRDAEFVGILLGAKSAAASRRALATT